MKDEAIYTCFFVLQRMLGVNGEVFVYGVRREWYAVMMSNCLEVCLSGRCCV